VLVDLSGDEYPSRHGSLLTARRRRLRLEMLSRSCKGVTDQISVKNHRTSFDLTVVDIRWLKGKERVLISWLHRHRLGNHGGNFSANDIRVVTLSLN
jgi:hypothetical protein